MSKEIGKGTRYEVDSARTKPPVDAWEGYGLTAGGAFSMLVSFGLCYLTGIELVNEIREFRDIADINLSNICAGLFGPPLILVMGAGSVFMITQGIRTLLRSRAWMRGSAKTCATIIDRREVQTVTALDYKYGGYTITYELILQVNGQPELAGRFIRADVSKNIFNRYARKDNVVIYYAPRSPLTFILLGE